MCCTPESLETPSSDDIRYGFLLPLRCSIRCRGLSSSLRGSASCLSDAEKSRRGVLLAISSLKFRRPSRGVWLGWPSRRSRREMSLRGLRPSLKVSASDSAPSASRVRLSLVRWRGIGAWPWRAGRLSERFLSRLLSKLSSLTLPAQKK